LEHIFLFLIVLIQGDEDSGKYFGQLLGEPRRAGKLLLVKVGELSILAE
jgi:hypothetical protein